MDFFYIHQVIKKEGKKDMVPSKILAAIFPATHSSQSWVATGAVSYIDIAIVVIGAAIIAAVAIATTKFVKKWN